jgi:enoyl-CoA hydratase
MPVDLASLRVERSDDGQVAEVVLLGPGRGNAMGPAFWAELPVVIAALDADRSVRVVLVRGDGDNFSYGLDLPAMMGEMGVLLAADGGLAGARTEFLDLALRMQAAITSVEDCRKPVVAAVQGWCIGGGVDLIAACDVRLCSSDARFSVREVKVAIVADMGSLQRLPGIVGEGWTRRLALTGEDVAADLAERIGLVSEVHADHASLLAGARELCATIASNPPLVVQGTKRILNASRDLGRAAALDHVAVWNAAFLPSHDLAEAVQAFGERRPPSFRGR